MKLWSISDKQFSIKNDAFEQFHQFLRRSLEFLSIRENTELFRNANEFYNQILKSLYIVSLSFQEGVFKEHIAHIRNFKGGRVDWMLPCRSKPFSKVSPYLLSNVLDFFPLKLAFSKFRLISRKFNFCFIKQVHTRAFTHETKIAEYSADLQDKTKADIENSLIAIQAEANELAKKAYACKEKRDGDDCHGLLDALMNIVDGEEDKLEHTDDGLVKFAERQGNDRYYGDEPKREEVQVWEKEVFHKLRKFIKFYGPADL